MKIRHVEAQFFRADGRAGRQTDMTKLIVAFRKFTNAHIKVQSNNRKIQGYFEAEYFV